MPAIYDREKEKIYVSADEICAFLFRGGNIDPFAKPGGKIGGFAGSYRMIEQKPQIIDEYSYTTDVDGIHLCIYAQPEVIRYDNGKYYVLMLKNVSYKQRKRKQNDVLYYIALGHINAFLSQCRLAHF